MIDRELVTALVGPLADSLARGDSARDADTAYWERRRRLLKDVDLLTGPGSSLLGELDVLMDSFTPDEDRLDVEIDEAEMRSGVASILDGLRALGLMS